MIGSMVGITVGGLSWIVLLGFVTGSPIAVIVPIVVGCVCWFVGMKLYMARPERWQGVIGLATLWIIAFNLVFVNLMWKQIPDAVAGITTGKSYLALPFINILLLGLSMLGFGYGIKDILHRDGN
jgi:hypothetical protein